MAKVKKKKYNFVQYFRCEKCGRVAGIPGPCEKCKGVKFSVQIISEVIKPE